MGDLVECAGMLVLGLTAFLAAAVWVQDGWLVLLTGVLLLVVLVEFCRAWLRYFHR